ncbi:hypothetical protein [Mucilaginibacter xinganensis]|uniref:Uncharacterized protein n=1 Tax=Mucilaginibacter xinganensis TaxID=1234841 RepID=A0A223NQF3_9SPHI|nr:hypothetical protein [Mucilaginibacter xinganensis]ASU32145.1 hypothetical protein MuYL_0242 [Mucilaginibacter xinganensis]
MNIENPTAFSFIMQDDIYLLNKDKEAYSAPAGSNPANAVAEPEPEYKRTVSVPPVAEPEPATFHFLGGHKKNFLVIVHYPEHDYMHEKHLAALESTLTRLGFSRDDVAIFNRAKYLDAEFAALAGFFKPQKLLLLGKSSRPAGLEAFELNKLLQLNGYPVLLTFSFDEMMDSVESKKAFWEQMKQL